MRQLITNQDLTPKLSFDIPANPPKPAVLGTNAAKDYDVAFETQKVNQVLVISWSDKRADVAAKDAVNKSKDIDAQDWSDLRIPPPPFDRHNHEYFDEDSPNDRETTDWLTQKNNKDF